MAAADFLMISSLAHRRRATKTGTKLFFEPRKKE
jgi:hypothetical protein